MSSSNNKAEEKITTTAPLENAPKVDDASKVKNAVAATTDEAVKKVPRKIIRRRRRQPQQEAAPPAVDPVLLDKVLRESSLPNAYSFEILKTVERIRDTKATHVALQMPEGLLMYATVIADLLLRLAATWCTQVSILGDVTYGACCIDDLGAQALGAELLVHYGHSCLVPLQHTALPCLYVFVEIQMDIPHLVDCVVATLLDGATSPTTKDGTPVVYLLGTVQFRHALAQARRLLQDRGLPHVYIPQAKPLSPGEVLGCTSPALEQHDPATQKAVVCFVADGRFHLESTLISNPHIDCFYRYDPYSKALTTEGYEHVAMHDLRQSAIQEAKSAQTFGVILGTLGRQGNPAIVLRIQKALRQQGRRQFLMLLSEITPAKLKIFGDKIDAWVQVACPRLSVDWGHHLSDKPVLSPYELFVCLEETEWKAHYPMDFYSQAGGPWTNYYAENKDRSLTN